MNKVSKAVSVRGIVIVIVIEIEIENENENDERMPKQTYQTSDITHRTLTPPHHIPTILPPYTPMVGGVRLQHDGRSAGAHSVR